MGPRVTDWKKDDILAHEHLQEPVDAIRDLFRMQAAGTPRVATGSASDARHLWLIGKIDTTGPLGSEDDYTDERYWVRIQGLAPTDTQADQITLQGRFDLPENPDDDEETPVPLVLTATNPSELAAHTHSLVTGTPVMLLPLYDAQDVPTLHYLIISVGPALPVGELDGMVYQNTSQDTGGFADVRLVNRA
jgi:hypothetical protein